MDIPEKENVRDYENKVRDKQKVNRQYDYWQIHNYNFECKYNLKR